MLNKTVKDDKGNSLGTNRDMLQRRNPKDERLKDPVLSDFEHYWMWVFSQLNRGRRYDQGQPHPIGAREILDYQQLFSDTLLLEEVMLLQAMDSAFIEAVTEG